MNEFSSSTNEIILSSRNSKSSNKQKRKSNKNHCAICSCCVHIIVYFGIYYLLFLNYTYTSDLFELTSYINLKPEEVCVLYIEELNECLKNQTDNSTENECQTKGESLEKCIDNVYKFNELCGMYVAEFVECGKREQQCRSLKMDIKNCGNWYTKSYYVDIMYNINEKILKNSNLVV